MLNEPMVLTFGVVLVLLLNNRSLPVVGAVPFDQFAVVLQLAFAPPPLHVKIAAEAVDETSRPDATKATISEWRMRVASRAYVFIKAHFS
jgi:hypothetical protein